MDTDQLCFFGSPKRSPDSFSAIKLNIDKNTFLIYKIFQLVYFTL